MTTDFPTAPSAYGLYGPTAAVTVEKSTHASHTEILTPPATLLRIFHDLQHEPAWQFEGTPYIKTTDLQTIRVLHYPHRMSSAS